VGRGFVPSALSQFSLSIGVFISCIASWLRSRFTIDQILHNSLFNLVRGAALGHLCSGIADAALFAVLESRWCKTLNHVSKVFGIHLIVVSLLLLSEVFLFVEIFSCELGNLCSGHREKLKDD
jgi:hypothetical protein